MITKILNQFFIPKYFNETELWNFVRKIFLQEGLTELSKKQLDSFNLNFSSLDKINLMELNNTFIHQPFGSQKHPDIILFINNISYFIEMKTSKSNNPVLNSHIVIPSYIYIYSLKDKTLPIIGSDIISYDIYEYFHFLWNYKKEKYEDIGDYEDYDRKMINSKLKKNKIDLLFNNSIDINKLKSCKILEYTKLKDKDLKEYLNSDKEYAIKLRLLIQKKTERNISLLN